MPPKGSKAPRGSNNNPGDFAAVTIELGRDENDAQNVNYHTKLLDAWNTLQGHATFEGIVRENPPSIKDGGACAPFDQAAFAIAIAGNLAS